MDQIGPVGSVDPASVDAKADPLTVPEIDFSIVNAPVKRSFGVRITVETEKELRALWGAELVDPDDSNILYNAERYGMRPRSIVDRIGAVGRGEADPGPWITPSEEAAKEMRREIDQQILDELRDRSMTKENLTERVDDQVDIQEEIHYALEQARQGHIYHGLHDAVLRGLHQQDASAIKIEIREVRAEPRTLNTRWPPAPSIVDRIGAMGRGEPDPGEESEAVRDLRALWADDLASDDD